MVWHVLIKLNIYLPYDPTSVKTKQNRILLTNNIQILNDTINKLGFPGSSEGKTLCLQCRPGFEPQVGKIPWRRAWQPTTVVLPGEFHGQRSLAGYNPRDHKESDMTEKISLDLDDIYETLYLIIFLKIIYYTIKLVI